MRGDAFGQPGQGVAVAPFGHQVLQPVAYAQQCLPALHRTCEGALVHLQFRLQFLRRALGGAPFQAGLGLPGLLQ